MFRRGLRAKFSTLLLGQRGSISILTIGLFALLLLTTLILTDISSIYLAKRTLTLASEAAVQRGMKNLDQKSYYSGEYNLTQLLQNSIGSGEEDPGIPIDCQAGLADSQEQLSNWQGRDGAIVRSGISEMRLIDYQCDGFQIYIESAAIVKIPFAPSFIGVSEFEIRSSAGAVGERSETNNYYGFDFG